MSPKPSAFLETLIALLMPYFADAASDISEARSEIIETLAAYATRTRAELLQAAQIIALGMTALDVLAESKTAEMSMSLRLRHRGCANGLNRTMVNATNALNRRLACTMSGAAALPLPQSDPGLPDTGSSARENGGTIARTPVAIDPQPNGVGIVKPHQSVGTERDRKIWAGAMMDTLKQIGLPGNG